ASAIDQCEIFRQRRRVVALGTEIGEKEPALLAHRIRAMLHLAREAVVRLGGLLQTLSGDGEEPAVIRAADAVRLDVAVFERGAAVRTMESDEPNLAAAVAEEHQL